MLIEIGVRSHGHRLVAVDLNTGYICDGCKKKGAGWRYRCHDCNYDMDNFCATAPPSIPHPLSAGDMQLLSMPVEKDSLWCYACEKSVTGLRYYCSGEALHPCCARLPKTPTINSNTFHLSKNLSSTCNLCGQRNRGWAYVSTDYSIHVHCLLEASLDFSSSSNHSPLQLSDAPFQLTAAPSTSDHQQSKETSTAPGTLQRQPKSKTNHGAIYTTTRLLLAVIYALFYGDPSSLVGEFGTLISNNYQPPYPSTPPVALK